MFRLEEKPTDELMVELARRVKKEDDFGTMSATMLAVSHMTGNEKEWAEYWGFPAEGSIERANTAYKKLKEVFG